MKDHGRGKNQGADSTKDGRPAFYALHFGGWRDYINLLHPPYTLWHLSYVVLGAALSPTIHYERLGATLLAFFLAVGIAAHALDELSGRPLRTRIPAGALYWMAGLGLAGAVAVGIAGALLVSVWLLAFVVIGAVIVPAYNLEWFHGRFHGDFWFALSWGAFPTLTSYWANALTLSVAAIAGATFAFANSYAQRTLSSRVRTVRRRVKTVEGTINYLDGTFQTMDKEHMIVADEQALMLMTVSTVMLALAVRVRGS